MENNENSIVIKEMKTFISALPDTEKELKILLNNIKIFNNSDESIKFKIVGNKYVKSMLDDFELNNEFNNFNHSENENKQVFTTILDTDSFTSENVDFFVNIIWKQVEDSNYLETNLKKDFDKAYELSDEDLLDAGVSFYISFREASLFDKIDLNEIKKAKLLKKDMDSKVFTLKYEDLDEFEQISKRDINGFSRIPQKNKKSSNVFVKFDSKIGVDDLISYVKNIEVYDHVVSLLADNDFENFLNEFEELIQGDYSIYEDIFKYLMEINKEFEHLDNTFWEENQVIINYPAYSSKDREKAIELLSNFSKDLNELSNKYEQDMDKNHQLRLKSIKLVSSFSKIEDNNFEEIENKFIQGKLYFEEMSEIIEANLHMFIDIIDVEPVFEDDISIKPVETLINEFKRILNNLKSIKIKMNDLENILRY
ncbi:MAG: hypothetical protein FWH29_06305 [Methanobrevibacter sp.]|nr:hypothetical protein [Methanobrevibacter sp.]